MPEHNDSHTNQGQEPTNSLLESLQDQIQRAQEAGADASIEDQLN